MNRTAVARRAKRLVDRLTAFARFELLAIESPALRAGPRFVVPARTEIRVLPSASWNVGRGLSLRPDFAAHVEGNLNIGDSVFFNRWCMIDVALELTIGSDCLFGERVSIHDANYLEGGSVRSVARRGAKPIRIGDNVWVGANATILAGVSIGSDAVIAAGSVVTRDVGPGHRVGGVPARVLAR